MKVDDIELEYFDEFQITTAEWKEVLNNPDIFDEDLTSIIRTIYQFDDHSATETELTRLLEYDNFRQINNIFIAKARLIKEFLNKTPIIIDNQERLIHRFFSIYSVNHLALLELRCNLQEAIKEKYPDLTVRYSHDDYYTPISIDDYGNDDLLADIIEIFQRYPVESRKELKDNDFANRLRNEINDNFKDFISAKAYDSNIQIDMHVGQGSWIKNPWIGIQTPKTNPYTKISYMNSLHASLIFDIENQSFKTQINQGINDILFDKNSIASFYDNLFNYLNSIPEGYEYYTDIDNEYSFISKSTPIESLTEKTLEGLINDIVIVFEKLTSFYLKLSKEYVLDYNVGLMIDDFKDLYENYPAVKKESKKNHPYIEKFRQFTIHLNYIVTSIVSNKSMYRSKYSHGQGKWVDVAWAAIASFNASTKFTEGMYVIYHFSQKSDGIIDLSINFGLEAYNKKNQSELIDITNKLRDKVLNPSNNFNITTDEDYSTTEHSVIYKYYDVNNLDKDEIKSDLKYIMEVYEELIPEYDKLINHKELLEDVETNANYTVLEPTDEQIWKFAPGDISYKDSLWNHFLEDAYIAMSFADDFGNEDDYSIFKTFDDFKSHFIKINHMNDKSRAPQMLWDFMHTMNIGDIVVVNKGRSAVYGIGIIESDYMTAENTDIEVVDTFKHIRKVKWLVKDEFPVAKNSLSRDTISKVRDERWNNIIKSYLNKNRHLNDYSKSLSSSGNRLPLIYPVDRQKVTSPAIATCDIVPLNINLDNFTTNLLINDKTLNKIVSLLNAGKNIILEGVPGTGKTELARDFCENAKSHNFTKGYILTTATSDWSTFDLIGGLMPDDDAKLYFEEGVFLKALRENKFLIIDEINRADIDKSFGQLFTLLSGFDVELNYKINDNNIKIKSTDNSSSYFDETTSTYYMGQNFRIIGTMNNYDKESLFDLSYAFMRRFAFVEIDIPSIDEYATLIYQWNNDSQYNERLVELLELNKYRKLGPAIFKDMSNYLSFFDEYDDEVMLEAILSFVLPQFEGLDKKKLDSIKEFLIDEMNLDSNVIEEKIDELKGLLI